MFFLILNYIMPHRTDP